MVRVYINENICIYEREVRAGTGGSSLHGRMQHLCKMLTAMKAVLQVSFKHPTFNVRQPTLQHLCKMVIAIKSIWQVSIEHPTFRTKATYNASSLQEVNSYLDRIAREHWPSMSQVTTYNAACLFARCNQHSGYNLQRSIFARCKQLSRPYRK
jgi:hypothetical protein